MLRVLDLGRFPRLPPASERGAEDHARALSERPWPSVPALAEALTGPFDDRALAARSIFTWVALNLEYDHDLRRLIRRRAKSSYLVLHPESVLRLRSGICGDFARLFAALAIEAGIATAVVEGAMLTADGMLEWHAWSVVRLDGRWQHLDATAGRPKPLRVDYGYFLMSPEAMTGRYWPQEPDWQVGEGAPLAWEAFLARSQQRFGRRPRVSEWA